MGFLNGNVLWHLCWVLPFFLAVILYTGYVRRLFFKSFLGEEQGNFAKYSTLSRTKRGFRIFFLFLCIFFIFLAMARFYWGMEKIPYQGNGRDLLIVFDVSKSMLAEDVKPSRLAHGKYLVRELVKENPGDRFGLIAFAGSAFLECPLTLDKVTFLDCVKELSPDSIPLGGTNIEEAVRTALQAFKGAESSSCAIILVTDGDELQGASSRILSVAKQRGIPLFIAGIGEPGLPGIIRVKNEAGNWVTLRDRSGKVVDSRLNEKALKALAAESNGVFVRSTSANPGLDVLEGRIRSLEREKREKGERVQYHEMPQYPLVPALFFLLCFFLLGERRTGKGNSGFSPKKLSLFFLLLLPFFLGGEERLLPERALPNSGEKADVIPPPGKDADGAAWYNYGVRLQEENGKNIPSARILEAYRKAYDAGEKDPSLRARAMLNTGVVFYRNCEAILKEGSAGNNPAKALASTEKALPELDRAMEAFREAMVDPATERAGAKNQQLLLDFREKIREYQKKLKELIRQQEKARQDSRKALQDQKNDNRNADKNKDRKEKNKPENSSSRAQKSIQDLKEKAKDLQQKALEQQARKAEDAMKKAQKAQKEKKGSEAEKYLQEALDALGKDSPQNKENKNNSEKDPDKKDKSRKGQDPSENREKNSTSSPPPSSAAEEKKLDKEQARKLLELMAGDEKNLKEEMKERQKRMMRTNQVEKDW